MSDLKDLKIGDEVIYSGNYSGDQVMTVTKLTPTQVVCGVDLRFSKSTGRRVGYQGSGWSSPRIIFAEPDRLAKAKLKIRIARAESSLNRIKLTESTIDAAEALINAIKEQA